MSTQPEAPKIEFPCPNYPVKVVGKGQADYLEVVFEIVRKHAPECNTTNYKVKHSRNGGFCSVTLYITATGLQQLERLHVELMAHEYIHMVI